MAVKVGVDQPWLADAAASLAKQTGASVSVVSMDELETEMLSTRPRSELTTRAADTARAAAERIREQGVPVSFEGRSGPPVRGILLYAEEHEADIIMVGASSRGPVAARLMGDVPTTLVQRSRRPVLVVTPPSDGGSGVGAPPAE